MAADKTPRKLSTSAPEASAEALEQADAYDSIFGATPLELDDGDVMMIPPHPQYGMVDDDRLAEWDELLFTVDTVYDREPDIFIPEQKLNGLTLPAETRRGALLVPYRITNAEGRTELVKPAHSVKVVEVALGEVEFKRLKEGGRNASDVWKIWGKQSIRIKERQQRDSKSAPGTLAVAPVPAADS